MCTRRLVSQPVGELIDAERIGQRMSIATCLGRLVGVEYLIQHPGRDEETEKVMLVGDGDQNDKNKDVNHGLDELTVVHGPDAGNNSQKRGERRVRPGRRRRDAGRKGRSRLRARCTDFGCQTLFAVDEAADWPRAFGTQCLAAVLAIRCYRSSRVIDAVHAIPLSA